MDSRVISLAGVVVIAGISGCSSPPSAVGTHTAQVTINGRNISPAPPVYCRQQGWNWMVETPDDNAPGFSAAFSTGADTTAHSVQIRGLDDFTGAFWEGTVGEGRATVESGRITLTGTASGSYGSNSDEATATFDIETKC